MIKVKFFLILTFFTIQISHGQIDSMKKSRLTPLLIGTGVGYGLGMVGMNELWYKNSPRSSFHFFNDAGEWKQMDKVGHCYSAFFESMTAVRVLSWAGLPQKKAIFWGCMSGIILQSPIEILDGFSAAYGASLSDLVANTAGSAMAFTQYCAWNEIRIQPKFSFHSTNSAAQRPNVLGSNFLEQVFKNYNGQTYWLSFNIYSFLAEESKFPRWLNVSLGYSAERMLYAENTPNLQAGQNAYRQYFLSLDIDLTKIKSKNKFVKTLLYSFNILHIPAPAIEMNKFGIRVHPLYY